MREGIQLSEALTGDGAAIFRHACDLGWKALGRALDTRSYLGMDRERRAPCGASSRGRGLLVLRSRLGCDNRVVLVSWRPK